MKTREIEREREREREREEVYRVLIRWGSDNSSISGVLIVYAALNYRRTTIDSYGFRDHLSPRTR